MNVYGVVYKDKGKVYYFGAKDLDIEDKTNVIVETNRGLQFAKVVKKLNNAEIENWKEDLKYIVRVATDKDYDDYLKNLRDASDALKNATKIAGELNLDMHFISSEFIFDRSQLLLNFYADERIDFRLLAKKLAGMYHTRIELRQIGARDKATCIGGIGVCGRKLCCSSFLTHIDSVSINMAKDQNLSLNPAKINGNCGRLLCCLAYENDEYLRCQKDLPKVGDLVDIDNEKYKVIMVDVLNRKYKAINNSNNDVREVCLDEKES